MHFKSKFLIIFGIITSIVYMPLSSETSTWTGNIDDDWNTAGNWDNGIPDGVDDTAVFTADAEVTLSAPVTVQAITLQNDPSVTISAGALDTLTFADPGEGNYSIQGGSFTVDDTSGVVLSAGAAIQIEGIRNGVVELHNITGGDGATTISLTYGGQFGVGVTEVKLEDCAFNALTLTNNSGVQLTLDGTNTFLNAIDNKSLANIQCVNNSENTFGNFINNEGVIQCYNSSINHFNVGVNNEKLMEFYGTAGVVGSVNNFEGAVNNEGVMKFYGVDDGGLGHSENNFNAGGTLTNDGNQAILFYDNSVNTFAAAVNNEALGSMQFYGDSQNTFNAGGTLENSGAGIIAFYGNSTNDFNAGATVENSEYGVISFYGDSENTFSDTVTNTASGSIYFSGNSVNDFSGAVQNWNADDEDFQLGSIQFFGDSQNTFNAAATLDNLGQGLIAFYGNSTNTFDDVVTNSGSGTISFYGNSTNVFNDDVDNVEGPDELSVGLIQFYGNSENTFALGTTLTNSASGNIYFYNNSNEGVHLNVFNGAIANTGTGAIHFFGQSESDFNGAVTNDSIINFYGNSQGVFAGDGIISGAGKLNIYGDAQVTISSLNNNYQGDTSVFQNGILTLEGSITDSNIFIGNANKNIRGGTLLTLGAAAQVGESVTLVQGGGGTLKPALGETMTIGGDYTQNDGTLYIQIENPLTPTNLDVAGDASLGGTLYLELLPGYAAGDYDIINAAGGVVGTFSSVKTSVKIKPTVAYGANSVTVAIPVGAVVLPAKVNQLKGNNKLIAKHLIKSAPHMADNVDAQRVINQLARQSAQKFAQDLIYLSPVPYMEGAYKTLHNTMQIAHAFNQRMQAEKYLQTQLRKENKLKGASSTLSFDELLNYNFPKAKFFMNTVDAFGSQLSHSSQSQMYTKTHGASWGWNKLYQGQWILEGGFGCINSCLSSQQKQGKLSWNSIYFAPVMGWFDEHAYANIMLLSGMSLYQQIRKIAYAEINRAAYSQYRSMDYLAQMSAGYSLNVRNTIDLQADVMTNVQAIYNSSYRECGADSLNLTVKEQSTHCLRSNFKLSGLKSFYAQHKMYTCAIYLNWELEMPLKVSPIAARFNFSPKNEYIYFSTYSNKGTKLMLGNDFTVKKINQLELLTQIEVDLLSHFKNYSVKAKLQWMF